QALAAGKRLLAQFPDHVLTLEALSELCQARGDDAAALEYARQALATNPLDRRLRGRLADAHRGRARTAAAAGDLAAARAELDAALVLTDGRSDVSALAQAAALAFKADDADAAEARRAQAAAVSPPAAAYALAAEAARLKLPRPLKQ